MKNLKIAEIVPTSCLEMTATHQYHMCLAHLANKFGDSSRKYTQFYRRMSDEGKYVLMDNGAAENSQLGFEDLIIAYKAINPTEIVLPDALCNSVETIKRTTQFYDLFKRDISMYKLMVVPQGNTLEEWCDCALELIDRVPVNSIGVSKFLEMETGEPDVRVRACEFLKNYSSKTAAVEIHMLGCSEGPHAVRDARNINPMVRGCDSAFVYICSKAQIERIDVNTRRLEGEIDFLYDPVNPRLSELMLDFETAAGVLHNSCDETWR